MAKTIEIKVPDIGGHSDVPVIELLVAEGDRIGKDQGLVTLESDKATMEVPAPEAGVVTSLKVKVGDTLSEGDVVAVIEPADGDGGDDDEGSSEAAGDTKAAPAKSGDATSDEGNAGSATPDRADGPGEAGKPSAASGSPASAGPGGKSGPDAGGHPGPTPSEASGRSPDIECQVLVLGAGPGGYTAAFRSADLDMDTVLVERYPSLGGVCLNVGCIPSKALLHAAFVIDEAAHAADYGIRFGTPEIDLDALRTHKRNVVGQLTKGLAGMGKQRKVRVEQGVGRFLSPHELEVDGADGRRLVRFEHCIIAAGSQPVKLPGFPWDDERVMDSTDALELAEIPKKLLVVGGGIIGLEMATVYRALGSEVTVVELAGQLMPGADPDLVKPLATRLKAMGVAVHLEVKSGEVKAQKNGIKVSFEGAKAPDTQIFDRVLVAVGRSPNGGKLDAHKAGVHVTERGFIPVDRQMRSNVPHIFAIGDLVGQPMLAHKATHEGRLAAEVISGLKREWVARAIPSVAYTDPEIAWVGLTEAEAKDKGLKVGVGKFPWAASGRAIGNGRTEGFTKLVFDEATHRVVGGGIVGTHAGDLIAEVGLAIEMGCEAGDIGHTIHPHPTLGESVAMAAEVFEGTITDLYIPKRKKG